MWWPTFLQASQSMRMDAICWDGRERKGGRKQGRQEGGKKRGRERRKERLKRHCGVTVPALAILLPDLFYRTGKHYFGFLVICSQT